MLIQYYRVESAHRAIKVYLGSKRTKGNLLSTWLQIEAALLNQVSTIETSNSSKRDHTPLELDRALFRKVFSIVT